MGEIEQQQTAASRLGAPESAGISTLEHGTKPPLSPQGKSFPFKVQMLDDAQETIEVPVSVFMIIFFSLCIRRDIYPICVLKMIISEMHFFLIYPFD